MGDVLCVPPYSTRRCDTQPQEMSLLPQTNCHSKSYSLTQQSVKTRQFHNYIYRQVPLLSLNQQLHTALQGLNDVTARYNSNNDLHTSYVQYTAVATEAVTLVTRMKTAVRMTHSIRRSVFIASRSHFIGNESGWHKHRINRVTRKTFYVRIPWQKTASQF